MSKIISRRDRRGAYVDSKILRNFKAFGLLRRAFNQRHAVISSDDVSLKDYANEVATTFRPLTLIPFNPRPWERATPALWAPYLCLAMDLQRPCFKFDMNLGPSRIKRAKDSNQPLVTNLRREIAMKLKRTLGRDIEFWFSLEYASKHENTGSKFRRGKFLCFREHLHGALGISADEVEPVKDLFKKIAGADHSRGHAVFIKPMPRPMGVGGYATKDVEFSVLRVLGTDAEGPRFTRSAFTRTDPLARRARRLYEFHRLLHQEVCRRHGADRIGVEDAFLDLQAA